MPLGCRDLFGEGLKQPRYWKKENNCSDECQNQPSERYPPIWQPELPTPHFTPPPLSTRCHCWDPKWQANGKKMAYANFQPARKFPTGSGSPMAGFE